MEEIGKCRNAHYAMISESAFEQQVWSVLRTFVNVGCPVLRAMEPDLSMIQTSMAIDLSLIHI